MRKHQSGFLLAYILMAVGIIGVSLLALSHLQRSDAGMIKVITKTQDDLLSQYELIRSQVLSCGILFPLGNNGNALIGVRKRYPRADTAIVATTATCPGSGELLINGIGGISLPRSPQGFEAWYLVNDATNLRLEINFEAGDPVSPHAATKAVNRIGDTASITGQKLTIILSL